ncbi:ParB/RepB/Spo0J family partition protein [Sandarakinorhabdus sp. DWP1-3-1]|uniref:ParB/RepB/Spo0J family partition protein n=1 Tax=Sandarakinorhabdus sp. DWP1-3-1 TaxID=2804627 RepID=UPI003CED0777
MTMELRIVGSPTHQSPDTECREADEGLAEILSGGKLIVADPRSCMVANFVARDPERPGIEPIQELIDSFRSEGQLQPILCRQAFDADGAPVFEVVMGVRRWLAALWLCNNDMPNFMIRIEIIAISDRDAFVAMDKENSAHATLSAIERGRSMHRALGEKLFKSQRELAVALNERPATVSTLVRLAEWPADLLAAFDSPFDILMVDAERLGPIVDDRARRGNLLREAKRIGDEQTARKALGKAPRTRAAVLNALRRSVRPPTPSETDPCTFAKIKKAPDGTRTLVISMGLPLQSRSKALAEVRAHVQNVDLVQPSNDAENAEISLAYPLLDFIEAHSQFTAADDTTS